MIDRDLLKDVKFKQNGDSCVLASFGVAAYPFTKIDVEEYFKGYFEKYYKECFIVCFKKYFTDFPNFTNNHTYTDFEDFYNGTFHNLYKSLNTSGYELLLDFINEISTDPFITCNKKLSRMLIKDINSDINTTEDKLKHNRCLLMAFINKSNIIGRPGNGHSITIGCDNNGFYYYDTNKAHVIEIEGSISTIGILGDGIIVSEK